MCWLFYMQEINHKQLCSWQIFNEARGTWIIFVKPNDKQLEKFVDRTTRKWTEKTESHYPWLRLLTLTYPEMQCWRAAAVGTTVYFNVLWQCPSSISIHVQIVIVCIQHTAQNKLLIIIITSANPKTVKRCKEMMKFIYTFILFNFIYFFSTSQCVYDNHSTT